MGAFFPLWNSLELHRKWIMVPPKDTMVASTLCWLLTQLFHVMCDVSVHAYCHSHFTTSSYGSITKSTFLILIVYSTKFASSMGKSILVSFSLVLVQEGPVDNRILLMCSFQQTYITEIKQLLLA